MQLEFSRPAGYYNNYDSRTYVVRCTETGRFKIGTSTRPWDRFCSLQIGSPTRLEVVVVMTIDIRGTRDHDVRRSPGRHLEKHLQARYADARIRGEWFEGPLDLEDLVAAARQLELATSPFARIEARGVTR